MVKNKKAKYNYEISETLIVGIKLVGCEIKSIRLNNVSMNDSYCYISNGKLYLKNMYIKKYAFSHDQNIDEVRDRQLLLTKAQLKKFSKKVNEKGMTIIPMKLFISDTGFAKLEIGLGKGKNVADKRNTIKNRDLNRDLARSLK